MCEPYPIIVVCAKKKKNQMITKKIQYHWFFDL